MRNSGIGEGKKLWRTGLMLGCGMGLGWLVTLGCSAPRSQPDFHLMAEAWNTIQQQYVARSHLDSRDLTYGAISGMVDSLGDTGHSTFLTPDMVKELGHLEHGEFKGIGIEVQSKDGHAVVVTPLDGSPAQHAGLRPGDIILKVANQDVTDWPLSKVVERIAGRAGTKVLLTIQDPHNGHTRQVTIVRASIKLHDVTWCLLPGTKVVHLRLASFDNGVTKDLRQALLDIQQHGATGIVLDLRNNPGGLLDEAVGVASQFLKDGQVLLAKDAKGQIESLDVQKGGVATSIPLVVLINEGSASAAEIVAGALRDHHRAELVGEKTFGTGTVLQEFKLSDGSALLLAVEEWLTPDGTSFWHKGLTPQLPVALPPDLLPLFPDAEHHITATELRSSDDRQLLTALQALERAHAQPPRITEAVGGNRHTR